MVIKNDFDAKIKMMEPQPLKFGMDRILSEETSSGNSKSEESCSVIPPCAGCLSSLYRCCRTSAANVGHFATFFGNGIHTPQPLRPYTNVLIPTEINLNLNATQSNSTGNATKRKRSWSRAVFSNLQRKGLEKRFQLQKYITKPDRRQLAATLGLTDAQVKVWFQNRRMKWRHTKESARTNQSAKEAAENLLMRADSTQSQNSDSDSGSDVDVQTVDN